MDQDLPIGRARSDTVRFSISISIFFLRTTAHLHHQEENRFRNSYGVPHRVYNQDRGIIAWNDGWADRLPLPPQRTSRVQASQLQSKD